MFFCFGVNFFYLVLCKYILIYILYKKINARLNVLLDFVIWKISILSSNLECLSTSTWKGKRELLFTVRFRHRRLRSFLWPTLFSLRVACAAGSVLITIMVFRGRLRLFLAWSFVYSKPRLIRLFPLMIAYNCSLYHRTQPRSWPKVVFE